MNTYNIKIETKFPEDLYRVINMDVKSVYLDNGTYYVEGEIESEYESLVFLAELHEQLSTVEAYLLQMTAIG